MHTGPGLGEPISARNADDRAAPDRATVLDRRAVERRTNLPANRWLPPPPPPPSRSHTATPPASHFGAERAAHREVGEGARVEEEMIVIEYEMSITWNEHAVQVGRGSEDGFSYPRDESCSFSPSLPASLGRKLSSDRALAPPSKQPLILKSVLFCHN